MTAATQRLARSVLTAWAVLILTAGCGYRPTSHVVKPVLEESVSTKVIISMEDPDNTVLLKDALDSAVVNRFRSALTDEEHASTHLIISLRSTSFVPVFYDSNGYITAYRAFVTLDITRTTGGKTKHYITKGTHLFTIAPNAIISDLVRYEAIQFGAEKALDSFVAQVANEGAER